MKREYFAYGSVLEALSFGLYPDKRHVIREFTQNSYDALNAWRDVSGEQEVAPVELVIQRPSIFIADSGLGMGKSDVHRFRYFGYSEKERGKSAGFRGIGKDSGLAVAERIIVTTSRYKDPGRYTIVVDAQGMLGEIASKKNPPLEELLEKHSSIAREDEDPESHYTFVELNNIRKDSEVLFDTGNVKDYLSQNTPVPLDPEFDHAPEVESRLSSYVEGFSHIHLLLQGEEVYKPFPDHHTGPEYVAIFASDEQDAPLIAYCWYCGHKQKGQFPEKDKSGLIYRLKNFAVGDRDLTRKTLWRATPERAFYFFGEIHVLDKGIVPSADRTDFEDNDARTRLYDRCSRIAQVLNQRAGIESAQRRFGESILSADLLVQKRKGEIKTGLLPDQLKPELVFETRKVIEDIEKRLKATVGKRKKTKKDRGLIEKATKTVRRTKSLLKTIESGDQLLRIERVVRMSTEARRLYEIVISVLKEEFSSDIERLKRIIGLINKSIKQHFGQ